MYKRTSRPRTLAIAIAAATALAIAAFPALAAAKDRNHDRIPDRWERQHDLSLKVNQAHRDQDGDALRNRGEYKAGTDPRDADSDGDGVEDGDEGAGTITAWDPETGELTIDLFGGKQVSGLVTDETEIECESDDVVEPDEETTAPRPGPPPGELGESAGPGPGPEHAGEHDCDGSRCSADDLALERVVEEASLVLTADGLVFREIELG